MAKSKGLEVDRRVGIALSVLPPPQKQVVERVIRSPQTFAIAAAQPGRVQQIATSGQPLYRMRVSPSLRLIYTMVGDTVYVVDVVERATLDYFAGQKGGKKSAARSKTTKEAAKVGAKNTPDAVKK